MGRFSCVCNFKKFTFPRSFPLNFSIKYPWRSQVPLKFETYNLHHCKKNCRKLVFLVFTKHLLYQIIIGRLHCYEVALVKKCNKPLLQKSEAKIFNQKSLTKYLLKVSEKNNLNVSRKDHIMYKFLTLSKRLQFWACWAFSHFTCHILQTTFWKFLKVFKNILTSYSKLCYAYVKFK